jgi:hypothetical protein
MLRARSARASWRMARKPPMFTRLSFLALMVQASVRSQISRTIDGIERSAKPGSRQRIK